MCLESLELRDDDDDNDESPDVSTEGKKLPSEAGISRMSSCPLTMSFCQKQRLSRLNELKDLHVPRDGDKEAFQLIKKLCTQQNSKYMKWFSDPVDFALIPDYRGHVPNPIDISTIENKLSTQEYLKYGEIVSDLRRIFTNAIRYNERLRAIDKNSNLICQAVKQMQPVLERLLSERFSIDVSHLCIPLFSLSKCLFDGGAHFVLCCGFLMLYTILGIGAGREGESIT